MESTHPRAEALQAAVARYLHCGEEELRGLLVMGLSVADIVEWKGRSLDELERALAGVVGAPEAGDGVGLVGQLMEVAEEGQGTWHAVVEQLIGFQQRQVRRRSALAW